MTKFRNPLRTAFLILWTAAAVLLSFSCVYLPNRAPAEHLLTPDIVMRGGTVITMDAADETAEALAVKNGKILAVGSNETINMLIGSNTRVIDLKGFTVTPGLIDSHCHFSGTDMLYVLDLSFPAVKKIDDVLEKVRAQAAALKAGEWIRGRGWDEGKLSELRYIYASDLDRVAPDNPVWLTQTMGHYGTANSYALRLAKVTASTPDPAAGTIDRYPDGKPTGVLKESAQSLVTRLIPRLTQEQELKGLEKIIEEFNREGMTAVKDPGLGRGKWENYQRLRAEGRLTVRVFGLWGAGRTEEEAQDLIDRIAPFTRPYVSTGDDILISGGVKMYMDGSGGARTAWLYQEWNKNFTDVDTGNYGYPVMDPGLYRRLVAMYHHAGLHISTHAIGDRAIDWVLDSYAAALRDNPVKGLRHGIIHCNIPTDRAIEMMSEMQKNYDAGYPEAQATFTWWIGDTYAGNFGPERSLRLMPFKTYLARGILWAGGSDFNVTPFAARYGIWASAARKPLQGSYGANPFGQQESVGVHDALRSYTIWAARQMFMEDRIGSLEPGKYADIAVWDRNLYSVPVDDLENLKCLMTLAGGKIVYQAPDSPLGIAPPAGR